MIEQNGTQSIKYTSLVYMRKIKGETKHQHKQIARYWKETR